MNENKEKISQRIGRYLLTLWRALIGKNPFRMELAEAKEQLKKATENVQSLQDQLFAALDHWEGCQAELYEANKALEAATETAACKQLKSMQRLVENLRERIKEKDAQLEQQGREFQERMEQMKADYQKRINEYNEEINKIQTASPR